MEDMRKEFHINACLSGWPNRYSLRCGHKDEGQKSEIFQNRGLHGVITNWLFFARLRNLERSDFM
ncbi:MAG: hypothetical protein CMM60_10635 [Rhodospirillaceae bacterium]|nr:hypothetical protein [Rhodospirillaceae bacterium]